MECVAYDTVRVTALVSYIYFVYLFKCVCKNKVYKLNTVVSLFISFPIIKDIDALKEMANINIKHFCRKQGTNERTQDMVLPTITLLQF